MNLKTSPSFENFAEIAEESPQSTPTIHSHPAGIAPCYYDWREHFPELQLLRDNFHDIVAEAKTIQQWIPWPEDHFAKNGVTNWTVFPFLHTFPAYNVSKQTWISSTCTHCPKTVALLKQIPNLRTALFSRLGSGVQISPHTGWADLANYVLRCHLSLIVPPNHVSGLWVDGIEQFHVEGEIIVFDDSKIHKAFNLPANQGIKDDSASQVTNSEKIMPENTDRIVLIIDILRPIQIPLGGATGSHTQELDSLISAFT